MLEIFDMCSRCTPTSLLGSYKEDRGGEPETLVAIEASDYSVEFSLWTKIFGMKFGSIIMNLQ